MGIERRTKAGYKLRVYIDAIADVEAMSDEQWADQWALANLDAPYVPRASWIAYLKDCALKEAGRYIGSEAA